MAFQAYMMEKIRALISIHYQLQNNSAALLYRLFDKYAFLNLDLDKV